MARTMYAPTLPGLTTTDGLDTVTNWGLGADSTARMLTAPAAHGIDLAPSSSTWPPAANDLSPGSWSRPLPRPRGAAAGRRVWLLAHVRGPRQRQSLSRSSEKEGNSACASVMMSRAGRRAVVA